MDEHILCFLQREFVNLHEYAAALGIREEKQKKKVSKDGAVPTSLAQSYCVERKTDCAVLHTMLSVDAGTYLHTYIHILSIWAGTY